MRHETIEQDVAALRMHYSVIEKMTGAYSDCIENRVCDTTRRTISEGLQGTTGLIPLKKNPEMEPGDKGTTP
jgi:hypothetical protein